MRGAISPINHPFEIVVGPYRVENGAVVSHVRDDAGVALAQRWTAAFKEFRKPCIVEDSAMPSAPHLNKLTVPSDGKPKFDADLGSNVPGHFAVLRNDIRRFHHCNIGDLRR